MTLRALQPGVEDYGVSTWSRVESGDVQIVMVDWNMPVNSALDDALRRTCERDADGSAEAIAARLQQAVIAPDSPVPDGMAVAFAALSIRGDAAQVAWAGDVRVAIANRAERWQTRDHTAANALRDASGDGAIEDALYRCVITRALGSLPSEPPDVISRPIVRPATVLLCSNAHHQFDVGWSYLDPLVDRLERDGVAVPAGVARVPVVASVLAAARNAA